MRWATSSAISAYNNRRSRKDESVIATYRNAHFIYNPTAGKLQRGSSSLVPRLGAALEEQGAILQHRPTNGPGHATRLAREAVSSGADLVVVAGGDGTLNEVINGLIPSNVPLAVIPAGTANVLANEMGLSRTPMRAAKAIPKLKPERVSVGLLKAADGDPRYFLLMAGVGLDAHIVEKVDLELKKWVGKLAYWIGGFGQLGQRFPQFHVQVNGDRLESSFTLAARVRNYGGDLEIARTASLLDDHFELVSFEGQDSFRYLTYLTGVLTNSLDRMDGVTVRNVNKVEFEPNEGQEILIQVDGELAGKLPASVEIVPDAVTLLMPVTIRKRYRRSG